jgi:hypothetical protein
MNVHFLRRHRVTGFPLHQAGQHLRPKHMNLYFTDGEIAAATLP